MFSPNVHAVTSQLNSDFALKSSLAAWAHTLLHTSLFPPKPAPPWFDRVNRELNDAKARTQKWLVDDYPNIVSGVPTALISFSDTFAAAAAELIPILADGNPTGDRRMSVVALFQALHEEAATQQWRVRGLQQKVTAFAEAVGSSSERMAVAANNVKQTLGASRKDLFTIESRIAELQRRLAVTTNDAKHSMRSAATTGGTVTLTLLAFTIAAGVGTAAFPVAGVAGAVLSIGVSAASEAARSAEVRALIGEIGELRRHLTNQQFHVAALSAVAASLQDLADAVDTALTTTDGVTHHWDDIVQNLALARELLDQPAVDVTRIGVFQGVAEAAAAWKTIGERARTVRTSRLDVATKTIDVPGNAA